uniref:hypothetical protein n=1 Tax=Nonomuraea bangladeshensis TaxID=404385 RepID=UPI003F4924DB
MGAVNLLQGYADIPNATRHYDAGENVPVQGVAPDGWLEAVVDDNGVIARANVVGTRRRRNLEEDLPAVSRTTRVSTTRTCTNRWTAACSSPG